jgi:hypothetical protein
MGWGGGTKILLAVVEAINDQLEPEDRRLVYEAMVPQLEEQDWDDKAGVLGEDYILDEIMVAIFPWLVEDRAPVDGDEDEDEDERVELCRECGTEKEEDGCCGTLGCGGNALRG